MLPSQLAILDVGHGNCAVLCDEKGIVIIDAGPGSTLLEFLEQQKIKRLDVILVSHADQDHIEGLVGVIASEAVEIGKVRLNSDASKTSALWDDLLYTLNNTHKEGKIDFDVSLTTRNTSEFDQGKVHIEVLAPSLYAAGKSAGGRDRDNKLLTSNTNSVVVRLVVNGNPIVLLPGDLDFVGLNNLIEDSQDCRAAMVIFPHHGGKPGDGDIVNFTEELCRRVAPEVVIFSIGRGKHKTPRPELVDAVCKTAPRARIMCTQLSEHCAANIPDGEQEYLNQEYARGKDRKLCCAGTIVVGLDAMENLILPAQDNHKDFIKAHIPTALCLRKEFKSSS